MLVGTDYKFLLFPKRCSLTNKLLWLCYAYEHIHLYTGPGEPLFEYKYYDKKHYLVNKLKGVL